MAKSKIPTTCKTFAEVPQDTCLGRLVTALKCEVKTGRLAKKVQKWFDETQGKQGDLQYHFRGKESWLFCYNFARLLTLLREEGDSQKQQQTVLALSLCWVTAEGFVLGICASIDLKWKILILSNFSL